MFTEKNIKAAFKMLCEMYDEEDRWMMDESDDFFALEGISNYCMAKALEEATTVASGYVFRKTSMLAEWSGSMCCTTR